MMNRRNLIFGSLAFNWLGCARSSLAATTCGPIGCESQIPIESVSAIQDVQHLSEWCWAASISMLFSYYGYRVPQEQIVQEAYGDIVNVPAMTGAVIAEALNRTWTDHDGQSFTPTTDGIFDAQAGIQTLDNGSIVQSIQAGRPMIIGSGGHCMVLTLVGFQQDQSGYRLLELGVIDPYPGRGRRQLQAMEMTPVQQGGALEFLASVSI